MRCSELCLDFIREMEGLRFEPYRVGNGRPTAGYGHELSLEELKGTTFPIDEAQAETWLMEDVKRVEGGLLEIMDWNAISRDQWDALVSFVYNVGINAFQKSTMWRLLLSGDLLRAGEQFGRWIYDNHEVKKGLVIRRNLEKRMYDGEFAGCTIEELRKVIREEREAA